jgi:hypothetical protein
MIQNVWDYLQLTTFCIIGEAPKFSNSVPFSGSYAVQTTWVVSPYLQVLVAGIDSPKIVDSRPFGCRTTVPLLVHFIAHYNMASSIM